MNSIKISLLSVIVLFVVISCDKQIALAPEEVILNAGAGKFGISHMKGMDQQGLGKRSSSSEVKQGTDARFDLGSIKGSTSFFFLLYNIGGKPITNISLSIPNTSFSVYPSKMDTLMPGNDVGMLPVVKINAFHGSQLEGIGSRPLMTKGGNTAVLQINGITKTAAGMDTTISFQVDMNLNALVLDIDLQNVNGAVDLTKPFTNIMGSFPEHITQMPSFHESGCDFKIRNNGNVPIALKVYYRYMGTGVLFFSDTLSLTVSVDSQVSIPRNNSDIVLSLDGSNTVSNPNKLSPSSNGRCYLYLNKDPVNCDIEPDTTLNIQAAIAFVQAQSIICSDVTNRMFVIDNAYVLWCFQGSCPSSINVAYRLYNRTLGIPVAYYEPTAIEGKPDVNKCQDTKYCELLDTIRVNISDPKLGLSGGHTVEEITLK